MARVFSYLKPEWFEYHFGSSQLSLLLIGKFAVIGVLIALISDVPTSWDFTYYLAKVIIVITVVAVVFFPVRAALTLLVVLLVVGRDFDTQATASLWQLDIGPIRPSWIVFSLLAIQLFKLRGSIVVPKFIIYAVGWFAVVPLVAGLFYGGLTGDHAVEEWIIDLKFPMMLLGVLLIFVMYLRANPSRVGNVAATFVGALAARHLVDLFDFLAGFGPELDAGISRVSEDSAKAGVVFIAFLGLLLIANHRSKILWGLLIAIPALTLIAAYGTRMIWIEFIASIPLILLVVRGRTALTTLAATLFVLVAGSGALYLINQSSAERVYDRLQYITEGRQESDFPVDVEYNLISRIDPIRYAEILNISNSISDRKAWLWGMGYGGYYGDDIVEFPKDLKSTFAQRSLDSGKFYRSHNYFSQFFLKYGLIGIIVASLIWLMPWYLLIIEVRRRGDILVNSQDLLPLVMLSISVFLLTSMLEMTWSGKGFFINGLILAMVVEYVMNRDTSDSTELSGTTAVIASWLR